MTDRYVEIDDEKYRFEDCFNCPFYQETESGDIWCTHPRGHFVEMWQDSYSWKEDGSIDMRVPGYFPDSCPARRITDGYYD